MRLPRLIGTVFKLLLLSQVCHIGVATYCTRQADCVGQEICNEGQCVSAKPTKTFCHTDQACAVNQACKLERCWEEDHSIHYCTRHKECPLQKLCENNFCRDAQPTTTLCKEDHQCVRSQGCRGGICWSLEKSKGGALSCKSYRNCTGNKICLHGECVQGKPTNKRCLNDSGCNLSEECVQGDCWQAAGKRQCESHNDCHPSMICRQRSCAEATPTEVKCESDADCSQKQNCKRGQCWTLVEDKYCTQHQHCKMEELCLDETCLQAEMTHLSCITDSNCPLRQACKNNKCWKVLDGNSLCNVHEDCVQYQVCISGMCKEGYPTKKACSTDRNCDNDEICKFGICVNIMAPQGERCSAHTDCDEDMLCKLNRCHAAVPISQDCTTDADCEKGGCKFEICWELTTPTVEGKCTTHEHCDAQKLCQKNICVVPEQSRDQCSSDLDCGVNSRCKLDICWILPDPSCRAHSDCGDYSVCQEKKCELSSPTGDLCHDDQDCRAYKGACRYGTCWSILRSCRQHRDCDEQDFCLNQYCRTAEPTGSDCNDSNECAPKEMCRHDICWKLESRLKCKTDNDCDAYSMCKKGTCVTLKPVDGACASSKDCPIEAHCKKSVCWTEVKL